MMPSELEEGNSLAIDFGKLESVVANGQALLPTVVQEVESGEVLLVGYVNKVALEATFKTKKATFWSSSRNELWVKGKSSGNFLIVDEIRINCEQNSLLYRVRMGGEGACHTQDAEGGYRFGCFYRKIHKNQFLTHLESPQETG